MENKSNYFKRDAVEEIQVQVAQTIVEEIEAEVIGNNEERIIECEMPENYY